ncbi:hypothetical protein NMG60_11019015 [Bertholletia excelsa]
MASNSRKLLNNISVNVSVHCPEFCSPERNGSCGICLPPCCNIIIPLAPPPSPDPSKSQIHRNKPPKTNFLRIPLFVLAAGCFLLCCYFIYRYFQKRWRRPAAREQDVGEILDEFFDEEQGPIVEHPIWYIRTLGLNPSVINAITVCRYKRGEGLVEGTVCSVCLTEFQEDETLRLLPKCNHAFHLPCIDTWLTSHTNCPLCRAGIVVGGAQLQTAPAERSVGGEIQVVVPEISGESRGREVEASEGQLLAENGGKSPESSDEGASELGLVEAEPVRRSVSMDSLSASVISSAMASAHSGDFARNSGSQVAKVNESNMVTVSKKADVNESLMRLVGSSSIGRSLQRGPISMKRSLSCSGKVLLSRYSRSRNSLDS